MKFREGQRVTVVDAGVHELKANIAGTVVSTFTDKGLASGEHGYKVELDGLRGGLLYFRESQLEEVTK